MESVLEEAAVKYKDKAAVKIIDVNKNPEYAKKYQIQGVPTLVFLDVNNNLHYIQAGKMTLEQIENIFNEMGVK